MTHVLDVSHQDEKVIDDGWGEYTIPAGWHVTCACGYEGNNPYDHEDEANEVARYHEETMTEEARLTELVSRGEPTYTDVAELADD